METGRQKVKAERGSGGRAKRVAAEISSRLASECMWQEGVSVVGRRRDRLRSW